jgi:hypothetical protein
MVIESTAAPVLAPVEVAIVAALGGGKRPSIPIARSVRTIRPVLSKPYSVLQPELQRSDPQAREEICPKIARSSVPEPGGNDEQQDRSS